MTPLFDAHNHLHDPRFRDHLADLPAAMHAAGIKRCVVNGSCEEDWPLVVELARLFPDLVLPSLGLHPWKVAARSPDWQHTLENMLSPSAPKAFLGECGLDLWMEDAAFEAQREVFTVQLGIAARYDLPLTVHCLRAWGPLLEILHSHPRPDRGFLLHSYGGAPDLVDELVHLGAYFSFSGPALAKNRQKVRDSLSRVPLHRLLCETDAPEMLPPPSYRPHEALDARGEALNHPANLPAIVNGVARFLGHSPTTFASALGRNFHAFFGLPSGPCENLHGI